VTIARRPTCCGYISNNRNSLRLRDRLINRDALNGRTAGICFLRREGTLTVNPSGYELVTEGGQALRAPVPKKCPVTSMCRTCATLSTA